MGKSQRKKDQYLKLYKKAFKKKVDSVIEFTPPFSSKHDFKSLFEEVYPDEVTSMQRHHEFYNEKSKRRKRGKNLFFPNPTQLLYDIARPKIKRLSEIEWDPIEAEEKKKTILKISSEERERKKQKYREKNISTQEVTPRYIETIMNKYWGENDKLMRLYMVQECGKYKNRSTIFFLRHILGNEKDWFIRNTAFRSLQRFDEVAYLPAKGRGKKHKYDFLVNKFGCDYKEDIGKDPADIMSEFYKNAYIQTLKDFDVFISHSFSNGKIIDDIVERLNNLDLVAFVDWKSDRIDLNRSKINYYSADVLKLRMRQSKCLLLVRTRESDSSVWVAWEIRYFSALGNKIVVLDFVDTDGTPEFIDGYPKAFLDGNSVYVFEGDTRLSFNDWLKY